MPVRWQPLRWWSILLATLVFAGIAALAISARRDAPPPKPVPNRAFPTPSGSRSAATVWAVGDGADGSAPAAKVASMIAEADPDRLLYLGDVYDSGTAREFRQNFAPLYGRIADRIAPTPGNHEWPNHDVGYDPYWQKVTGEATPPWYRFRLAGWDILSLNSEAPHGPGSEQAKWLKRQLTGDGTCRLAFFHRPRFSAGRHGDQDDIQPLWDLLRGRASLVLSGHDHNLQRLQPVDGLTQLVAGAGGRSHYDLDQDDERLAFARENQDGALRIDLKPGTAKLTFLSAEGSPLDGSSVSCSPTA